MNMEPTGLVHLGTCIRHETNHLGHFKKPSNTREDRRHKFYAEVTRDATIVRDLPAVARVIVVAVEALDPRISESCFYSLLRDIEELKLQTEPTGVREALDKLWVGHGFSLVSCGPDSIRTGSEIKNKVQDSYLELMKLKLSELKSMIRQSIKENFARGVDSLSTDDVLDTTQPKYNLSPEETLMHKLFAAKELRVKFQGKSPEQVAQALGLDADPEIIDLIGRMMDSRFYSS